MQSVDFNCDQLFSYFCDFSSTIRVSVKHDITFRLNDLELEDGVKSVKCGKSLFSGGNVRSART